MRLSIVCALALLILASAAANAAGPEPGKTVVVACKADPEQKYSCFLPRKYTPKKPWPILYCFSPNARGDAFVRLYRDAAEEAGWIVVGSLNAKNGPWEPIRKSIDAIWQDASERLNLCPYTRFASGFSGGARVSFAIAEMHSERFAGVIAIGAGLHGSAKPPAKELIVKLLCGEADPNRRELDPLFKQLQDAGSRVTFETFPGGHIMPDVDILSGAVRWMKAQVMEVRVERFRRDIDAARALHGESSPVEAYFMLRETMSRHACVREHQADARKLLKTLERVAAVKPEASAMKKLDPVLEWIGKNRSRLEKSNAARAEAIKKLEAVVNRYPGTRAASIASNRAGDLMVEVE